MNRSNQYTYAAVLTKEADGGYSVRFPQLDGCYTQGNTLADALTMASDALRLHLQGMVADGDDIPQAESSNPSSCDGAAMYQITVKLS
ncbi:MAG: type II toxin-antitoxin system HicB family antitoxin [Candidatus Limiplasma sp.]|nr:type II toxin-antitoxin system HicB family antitoxin [Candidatus Limiplasma sp.]